MLNKMSEEDLIVIAETGKRSKNIFALTEKGNKTLEEIVKERRDGKEKMYVFRNLLFEIFADESDSVKANLMEIRMFVDEMTDEKQQEAQTMIKKCLEDIRGIEHR